MMYPFMTLNDDTEITHSEMREDGRVKVNLGICKGKKMFDKRADIRERDVHRDMQREFRSKLDG